MTEEECQAIREIIRLCEFPEYTFRVELDGRGECYLQAEYLDRDVETGKLDLQVTRRWFLSPEMSRSEIVQTAFKCIITSREHSTREWFRYKGHAVFGPHFDVEALAKLCADGKFDNRKMVHQDS